MRRLLSTFVSTVCLLVLFISSAACVALPAPPAMAMSTNATMPAHTVSAPEHQCCPAKNPNEQHLSVSCCIVHHQPAAAASATDLNPSLDMLSATTSATVPVAAAIAPPNGKKTGPPLQCPATKLRI